MSAPKQDKNAAAGAGAANTDGGNSNANNPIVRPSTPPQATHGMQVDTEVDPGAPRRPNHGR